MNIVLLAPPASGKGTQAEKIVSNYHLNHISTGDLLRASLKNEDELSSLIKEDMEKGTLVSDEIILKLIEKELEKKTSGYIFDGFPRTLVQAKSFDETLSKYNEKIDAVIYFDVPKDELVERICGRRTCPNCKRIYNVMKKKPKMEEMCDFCNTPLDKRDDDNKETFEVRYETYIKETDPLIKYYEDKNILTKINAFTSIDEVYESVKKVLDDIH